MYRAVSVLLGLLAVVPTPRAFRLALPDVDATTFALAFRAGRADQYKNRQIHGVGTSFHGAVTERIADGSTRTSLVITLGSTDPDGRVTTLNSWDDFLSAERRRATLVVALSGPDLPPPPTAGPTVYEFSGVYDGQVRTIARAPVDGTATAGQNPTSEDEPCPGEQPRDQSSTARFYCAPLLTGATATIRR